MNRKEFFDACSHASKALKGGVGNLNLKAVNGHLQVSAASPNLSIVAEAGDGCPDMELAVKASTAVAALGTLPGEDIILRPSDAGLLVSGGKGNVFLPALAYSEVEAGKGFTGLVETHGLLPYVSQVMHSLGEGMSMPAMASIHLEVHEDGSFRLTALDGRRYSIRNTAAGKHTPVCGDFVVFGREFHEALKLAGDGDVDICSTEKQNAVHIISDRLKIRIGLLDGPFFNMERIRAKELPRRVFVQKEALEEAVNLVKLVSGKIFLDFAGDHIFAAADAVCGKAEMTVPVESRGMEDGHIVKAAFNAAFLSDALQSMDAERIAIHFRDAMNQFCLTDGKTAIEMVLPIRRGIS